MSDAPTDSSTPDADDGPVDDADALGPDEAVDDPDPGGSRDATAEAGSVSDGTVDPDSGAPAGELPLVDGEVVSYDDEAVASYDAPELPQSAPSTGDDTPGATMGQYQKTVEEAKHLSEDSEETMEEIEGGDLPDPEDTASASSTSGPIGAMSLSVSKSACNPFDRKCRQNSSLRETLTYQRDKG